MVFIERYEFTYQDYLNYCDSFYYHEPEEYLSVAEPTIEYVFDEEKQGDKKHDKIFKDILQNKEEMAKFLNKFIKYEIEAEQLEIHNFKLLH